MTNKGLLSGYLLSPRVSLVGGIVVAGVAALVDGARVTVAGGGGGVLIR